MKLHDCPLCDKAIAKIARSKKIAATLDGDFCITTAMGERNRWGKFSKLPRNLRRRVFIDALSLRAHSRITVNENKNRRKHVR